MGGIKGFDGTGKPVVAPDAATADAMFERGELAFQRGQKVAIRGSDGSIWDIPAESYAEARGVGARLVSEEEIQAEKLAKETQEAGPLGAALRTASDMYVNAPIALGGHLGDDARAVAKDILQDRAKRTAEAEKQFPVASTVGTVAGAVAPALLTAGTSTAATGAAAVTARGAAARVLARGTVPGIANTAGVTAENLALRTAARIGLKEGTAKAAGLFAQGAAEGAAYGAADAMVQATLNDVDLTAEAIMMAKGAGAGALFGGAGNAAFGVVGKALAKGAGAAKDQITGLARRLVSTSAEELGAASPAAANAAEGVVARFLGAAPEPKAGPVAKGVAKAFNVDEADAARMFNAAGADAVDNPKRWVEKSTEKVTNSLDEIVKLRDELDDELFIGVGKLDTIKKVTGGSVNPELAAERAASMFSDARERIGTLAKNASAFERYSALNKLADELGSGKWEKEIAEAIQREDAGSEIMFVMDNLKREIGRAAKERPGDIGPVRALKDQVSDIYESLRVHLEDEGVFGAEMAGMQREVNAGYTKSLRQSRKYNRAFREITGSDGFDVLSQHAPKKITPWVERAGEFENKLEDEALAEMLEGTRERAASYSKRLGDKRADALIGKIDGFRDTWRRLVDENQTRVAAQKVSDQAKSRAIFGSAAVAGLGMMAGASGGESLTGAGIAGAAIANPAAAARALAAVRSTLGKRSSAILGAAGGVAERARGAASKAGRPVLQAAKGAALFTMYRDAARAVSSPEEPRKPPPELDVITPGLGAAVAKRQSDARQFLKSKLPSGAIGQGMFGHLEAPPVTEYQARTFLEYVRGAEDPLGVLEEVRDGNVSPEAVEAVKAIYPRTFAEIQQVVSEQLAGLKKPPPYQSRLELYRVFGVAADRSLSPEFFATMAAIRGQEPEAPQAQTVGAASSERSRMLLSDTARTLSR